MNPTPDSPKAFDRATAALAALRREIGKVVVGQEILIDRLLIALVTGGHILLEGVPGLAKTTTVKTLSQALGLSFQRISFTPDLLPADIIGTLIYDPKAATFTPHLGPVFTNLLLADEINRAPAKVQSALLEAMQERQVTIGDRTHALPHPFLVLATQNPIEQDGTYPLPEAQVDRFLFKCVLRYPSRDEERQILHRFAHAPAPAVSPVISADDIRALQAAREGVFCDDKINDYILDLVFATREPAQAGFRDLEAHIAYGASPRATLFLNAAARAHALLQGRTHTVPHDVKAVAHDVLRHRVLLTYEAEAEDVTADGIIDRVLAETRVP